MCTIENRQSPAKAEVILYIVPTQHFDILWRRPMERYREIQSDVIRRVIELMRQYPEFRYTLQQTNVIRAFLKRNPDLCDEFARLIQDGRLEVAGGSETLPDSNLISGESVVRNLLYGRQWLREKFGIRPPGASFLDCFGSSAQIPQILKGFGYEWLLPGRMPGADCSDLYPQAFTWRGLDGTVIDGLSLGLGICGGDGIGGWYGWGTLEGFDEQYEREKEDPTIGTQRVLSGLDDILKHRNGDKAIFMPMMGEEHLPTEEIVQMLLDSECHQAKVVFSTFGQVDQSGLTGEHAQLAGEYNPVFTGCYTTRIRLKQLNRRAETNLYSAEFLASMASVLGVSDYPRDELADCWRKMAEFQFHDSICGCHIDDNYATLMEIHAQISKKLTSITSIATAAIGSQADTSGMSRPIVLFNTLPWRRRDLVKLPSELPASLTDSCGVYVQSEWANGEIRFIADLPAGGFAVFNREEVVCPTLIETSDKQFNVGRYEVRAMDHRLSIYDTVTNREVFSDTPCRIRVREDTGTLWTEEFSGAEKTEDDVLNTLNSIERTLVCSKFTYTGRMEAPGWPEFGALVWSKVFTIYNALDRIDVEVHLDWSGRNTEVSLQFPLSVDISSARAMYEIPFGCVERTAYSPGQYAYGRGNWPALSWVDYRDESVGYAIAHSGTPGCVADAGVVSFSLLRSATGHSIPLFPAVPEPLSFDNGKHTFGFSIIPHKSSDTEWLRRARQVSVPVIASAVAGDGSLGRSVSFLKLNPADVMVSTVKAAENGDGLVLRIFDQLGIAQSACVEMGLPVIDAVETNMEEDHDGESLRLCNVPLKPWDIKSIRVRMESLESES